MKKKIIITFLIILNYNSFSQKKQKAIENSKPKIVVGLVVDQMRYDFLYRYYDKYSENGFKRLMNEGFNCKNLHYNYAPTVTAAGHAAIFTGSIPSINGMIGNEWYDKKLGKIVYCVEDSTVKTVGTSTIAGKMSPKNLLVSTIADQLKLSNNFQSKTIGIALKDRGAILPAGHTANGAYWYDGSDGSWISSTYYMNELPSWAKSFNDKKLPLELLKNNWNTLLPINQYTESTADNKVFESKLPGDTSPVFPHNFDLNKKDIYEIFRTTPFGNTLTKEMALAAINGENLGNGKYTDFLTVSFSSPDYIGHAFGPNSIETEDCYLRLDKDIGDILTHLDTKFGKNNYVVFLTADHGVADVPGFWKENKLPAGILDYTTQVKKMKDALFSKFGIENLVSAVQGQIYLNDVLMREKGISINQIIDELKYAFRNQAEIVDFINLKDPNTSNQPVEILNIIKNGVNNNRSGDIFMMPAPMYFTGRSTGTTHGALYNYDTHVPALFMGWHIPKGESSVRYAISDIAPTVSNLLNILEGSGNIGNPILMK